MAEKHKKKNNVLWVSVLKRFGAFLFIAFLFSFCVYQFIEVKNSEIKKEMALQVTEYDTVKLKAFVVRDEEYIENSHEGTSVSFVEDGERVAKGDTVSIVFDSPEDADLYLKRKQLESSIQHYTDLSGQVNFQNISIESFDKRIDDNLHAFLDSVDNRQYDQAVSGAQAFRDSLTSKQIAVGQDLDFSSAIKKLQKQLDEVKDTDLSYNEICAEHAGYYISGADGYERAIDYSKLDELTAKDVSKVLKSKGEKVGEDVVGRLVSSFKWYFVCVADNEDISDLSYNKTYYINIQSKGIYRLPVTVYKLSERSSEKDVLILCCDNMSEELSSLRIEDIELITKEYTGYKISNSAIRKIDGELGVFIVRGKLMGFRKVNVVHYGEDYTLVNNPKNSDDYIHIYDTVVTEGVDLNADRIVG